MATPFLVAMAAWALMVCGLALAVIVIVLRVFPREGSRGVAVVLRALAGLLPRRPPSLPSGGARGPLESREASG